MPKLGRPFVYQSDEEKPVTVSLRIPRDLYEQAQRYVSMRVPMTMTELLLDGLRLRLETPADPRDLILSDDNTVMQQLQEMVNTAVQAALERSGSPATQTADTSKLGPIPASPIQPEAELSQDDNTVLQEQLTHPGGGRGAMRRRIIDLLREHPEGLTAEELRVYLKSQKPLGDTLQGMVRQHLLEKEGRGNAVRYTVLDRPSTE